jgi:hypothetical protein
VLHPVGKLPAAVYWRRRLTVLALVLAVLGGAAWLVVLLLSGRDGADAATAAASASARSSVPVPALERVVPSVGAVSTPTPPEVPPAAAAAPAAPPAPAPGDPCTDDMISVEVRTPPTAAVGSKPTFELLVANVSAVPCVRPLDKGLQELLLLDSAGTRVWGSNDCFPEAGVDTRTLPPGEVVAFPVLWGGLTSEPTCTAPRVAPAPGTYAVRGRLDTKISPDVPLTLG